MLRKIQVAQRQQVLPAHQSLSVFVHQIVRQPARLQAGSAVAAARRHRTAQVALPAVRDANRPVHERLDPGVRNRVGNPAYLRQGRSALENDPRKTGVAPKPRPVGSHRTHLRRGVQLDRRKTHPQKSRILHDQRIGTRAAYFAGDAFGLAQFVGKNQRIHRHEHPHAETVRIVAQPRDVADRNGRIDPRAETGRTDVQRVGAAIDGGASVFVIFGRSQQFDRSHRFWTDICRKGNKQSEFCRRPGRVRIHRIFLREFR